MQRLRVGGRARWWAAGIAAAAMLACLAVVGWLVLRPGDEVVVPGGPLPALAPLPEGFPPTLALGMADSPGGAATMETTAPFAFRYQYLAGGLDDSWTGWSPEGKFVPTYIAESDAHGMGTVFTYYMLQQSAPGGGDEAAKVGRALKDRDLMRRYFENVRALMQQSAGKHSGPVIVHVEPDLWGFLQQEAKDDRAGSVAAAVASTGLPELEGLPDSVAGLAQAFVRLRDEYAPGVLLAYHVSNWGSGHDYTYGAPSDTGVDRAAEQAVRFYQSLGARFDLTFAEFSDRDAGFNEAVRDDGGASWWTEVTFARHLRFLGRFAREAGLRVVLWQVPYGNTMMRASDNTPGHYQDNRVEWLLGEESVEHLRAYADAGVAAILFGRGADGATDARDAAKDGVTDPAPINGNTRASVSADDDGGYFRERSAAYYRAGPVPLP